jgi:hypothetical protein
MKKLPFVAAALLLPLSVMATATTDANAEVPRAGATVVPGAAQLGPIALQLPTIKGTVSVPASVTGNVPGMQCNQIQVYATSKEMVQCQPGDGFCSPYPKWTRHVTASGANGQCNYAMYVPASSAFSISASTDYAKPAPQCGFASVQSSGTGASITVAPKETKIHNFSVTGISWTPCAA